MKGDGRPRMETRIHGWGVIRRGAAFAVEIGGVVGMGGWCRSTRVCFTGTCYALGVGMIAHPPPRA